MEGVCKSTVMYCRSVENLVRRHQKHYANDEDELERYGFFKKSKAHVAKHDDQSKQQDRERTNLDYSCHRRDNVTTFGASHGHAQLHDKRIMTVHE